jgi:hypothetical protein
MFLFGNFIYNKVFRCIAFCCLLASLVFADSLENADSSKIAYPQLVYSVPYIEGLKVTPHSRSIQILSEESVTLYLFDRRIDLVFTKKIPAGFNFISLENHKQGIYYGVLQVGELMQVVKVVVI